MTKLEVQKRVTKNGKPLALHLFTWDEETKTFSSSENGLILDFREIDNCTFFTGSYYNFKTGSYCIFNTNWNCTFKTGSDCIFNTNCNCIFDTGWNCNFKTGKNSVIVRRDVFEVIVLEDEINKIQLNEYGIKGYKVLEEKTKIVIDGKEIEISNEDLECINKIVNKGK